jgi:hypothetical protein
LAANAWGGSASAETVLNVVTAGSENMVDYVTDYLAPKFKETQFAGRYRTREPIAWAASRATRVSFPRAMTSRDLR